MAHPFEQIFERALKKSTSKENMVLIEAEMIYARGYPETEILEVLRKLKIALLDDTEEEIVRDAIDEFIENRQ